MPRQMPIAEANFVRVCHALGPDAHVYIKVTSAGSISQRHLTLMADLTRVVEGYLEETEADA